MAGRFEGLSDLEWKLFADLFPPEPPKRGRGMPHTPFRKVVNTLLYVLITGCRWCDLPRGPRWASKSAAHRWLQRWQADGTLAAMQARLLGLAEERGMIQWQYGAIDGSFSPWQGRWRGCRTWQAGERDPHPQPHRWGGHAIVRADDTCERR
jgi:transposase